MCCTTLRIGIIGYFNLLYNCDYPLEFLIKTIKNSQLWEIYSIHSTTPHKIGVIGSWMKDQGIENKEARKWIRSCT